MQKMNLKKVFLSLIVTVVVFGLVGCGKKQPVQVEQPEQKQEEINKEVQKTEEVDTSNWQTYKNEEFGFEIKCPEDWKIKENKEYDLVSFNSPRTEKFNEEAKKDGSYSEGYMDDITISYYLNISEEPENKANKLNATTIEEFISRNPLISEARKTTIGEDEDVWEMTRGGYSSYYTILTNDDKGHVYEILFGNKESKDSLNQTENSILKSFMFVR